MIVRPRKFCISLLYIMIYVCAIAYIRWSYVHTSISEKIYIGTQLIIVLICLMYVFLSLRAFSIRFLPCLLGCFLLYEIIISVVRGLFIIPNFYIDALPWPLVITVFCHYSKKEQLPLYFKHISIAGMIIVCILSIPNIVVRDIGGTGVFGAYYCISMLAMVYMFSDDKKICGIFSFIVSILMVITAKRTAVIIMVLGVGIYYLLKIQIEEQNIRKIRKISGFILIAMFLIISGIYLINRLNLTIISRLLRMFDDGGSGRTRIWELVLNLYRDSDRGYKIFGHGFHSVFYLVRPFGISRYAHNSYIETLYDYGIVGISLLLAFVLELIICFIRSVKMKNKTAPAMGFTVITMLGLSLTSYFFEQSVMILPLCVIWGMCLNKQNVEKGA